MANPVNNRDDPAKLHLEQIERDGFKKKSVTHQVIMGQQVKVITLRKNEADGLLSRIGYVGLTVAAGPLNVLPEIREETIQPLVYGYAEKKHYEATGERIPVPNKKTLGYNPNSRADIRRYVMSDAIRPKLLSHAGHLYLPETRIKGISGFLFVPSGDQGPDFKKARFVKTFWTETKASIENAEDQMRATLDYCDAKNLMDAEWDKHANVLAMDLGKKRNATRKARSLPLLSLDQTSDDFKALVKEVNKQRGFPVLDPAREHGRFYSKRALTDLNYDIDSYTTGTQFTFSKEVSQAIAKNHDKNQTDLKSKPQEERPYAHDVPKANQETPISDDDSEIEGDTPIVQKQDNGGRAYDNLQGVQNRVQHQPGQKYRDLDLSADSDIDGDDSADNGSLSKQLGLNGSITSGSEHIHSTSDSESEALYSLRRPTRRSESKEWNDDADHVPYTHPKTGNNSSDDEGNPFYTSDSSN